MNRTEQQETLGSTLAEKKKKAGNGGFEKRNWLVIRILKRKVCASTKHGHERSTSSTT